jgi:hypothetical protein
MTKYCCEDMELYAERDVDDDRGKYVDYDLAERFFSIYAAGSNRYGIHIPYCPFCGSKLPELLVDERWDTILTELGPDYLPDDDNNPPKKELPEEFKTDEWWKKRGL